MKLSKTFSRSLVAGAFLASATLVGSSSAFADDPAHHSTDVSDPDPAHHRPVVVFSASTGESVLVPVAGFDLNGYPVGGGNGGTTPTTLPAGYDNDPAHHSTDVNDGDPAHHQPYWVAQTDGTYRLVPIPGFDLSGNRISASTFA